MQPVALPVTVTGVPTVAMEDGADEVQLKQIESEVRERVAEAAQFAQDSPEPNPAELWTDVLAEA